MSTFQNFSLPPQRFLTVAGNILHRTLLDAQRAAAKRIFNDINEGRRVELVTVQMDDETELRFDLTLDSSEFRGDRLNFTFFRNSVQGLVAAMGLALKEEGDIPIFREQGGRAMLFGVPGVTRDTGEVNVMMMSSDMRKPGSVVLKLQYMDPSQFQPRQQAS
ncbi:MAG: hypothetical protein V2J89_00365 [Halieaceae bacterium]|jgi:hypothetical protein|nr:hypothetical protein [Halieaceae bacterium]